MAGSGAPPPVRLSDPMAVFRATVPVQGHGVQVSIYEDVAFLLRGRSGASFSFENTESPFHQMWLRTSRRSSQGECP